MLHCNQYRWQASGEGAQVQAKSRKGSVQIGAVLAIGVAHVPTWGAQVDAG
jgi:hypothetical protein